MQKLDNLTRSRSMKMENENTDIQLTDKAAQQRQPVSVDPDAPLMVQIMQLSQQDVKPDIGYIKGLLEVKREIEADERKAAYAAAFTAAQADIGGVVKTRKNKQTNSMYAGLDDVIEMSKTVCAEHGFSISFSEGVTAAECHIRICATILHKEGHKETPHYDVPLGGVGIQGKVNMTAIHAKATSVSYGQRYLLCMIWNIPTKDIDGNAPPPEKAKPRATTRTEQEVIDAICDALPPSDVGVVDKENVKGILLQNCRDNLLMDYVGQAADYLVKNFGEKLYVIDTRSDFEQSNDLDPDPDETYPEGHFGD